MPAARGFLLAVLAALPVLGGCAGQAPRPVAASPAEAGALPLQALPPDASVRGRCALVLWTRTSDARRILMVDGAPPVARIRVAGETLQLPRISAEGEAVRGQTARAVYAGRGVTVTLDLDLSLQRDVPGGVALPEGVLDYRDPAGWSMVVPVGGLIACEP